MEQTSRVVDLFVFDFDYTVITDNSDTCFYSLFPDNKCPEALRSKETDG